jgi:TatD DNase family protein
MNSKEDAPRQHLLFDSHCHLQGLEDPVAVWARAQGSGVEGAVCAGTDPLDSRRALELARELPGVLAAAGLHPHEAGRWGRDGLREVGELLAGGGFVAVGECGLDYHYDYSPRPDQRDAFSAQVELANHYRLPLVVHSREAWEHTWEILQREGVPEGVVFHCFTGGPEEAKVCLEMGAVLSFSGIVSFPKADALREAARICPLDRMLVETDSPYLTPVPLRGRPNEPAYVAHVVEALARAREEPPSRAAEVTTANAKRIFARLDGES